MKNDEKAGFGSRLAAIASGDLAGSVLARRLWLPLLFLPFFVSWLVPDGTGFYEQPLASVLHIGAQTLFVLGLAGGAAFLLNRADARRRCAEQEKARLAKEVKHVSEEAMKKANEELEQRVARRTEALRAASLSARQSETRYRSLVTASAQIIWTTNDKGEVIADMPTWRAFTGQTFEEIQGYGWASAIHPEDRERVAAAWSQAVASHSLYEIKYRLRRQDGQYRQLAVRGVPVLKSDHLIREWVGACTDITKQQTDEKRRAVTSALLELFAKKYSSKEYLDGVVEVIRQWTECHGMGIRVADNKNRDIRYESWAGFEPQFIEAENHLNLERDNCFCVRAILQKCDDQERSLMTSGGSFRCENSIQFANELPQDKQDRYRGNCMKFGFASLAILPIRYQNQILGAIHLADRRPNYFSPETIEYIEAMSPLIGEAIQRFQAEAELNRYRTRLEELVKHRTAELESANSQLQTEVGERTCAQENLRQTAEELARSNQDLEQFAYVASHDLQEPLRAVSGYVQLLERRYPEKLDAKGLQYIKEAVDGAERMQRLINDLLAFSRVGTRGLDFQPADLNEILDNALQNLKTSIRECGARVTSDPLPTLPADATQFGQLFQNLIGNAIKFRGEKVPEIHVGAQRQEDAWHFSVRDNGIGIEPQYFERVFQIFQRLHSRKLYSGTGIGLAICKKIVERHGGTIWIESQPGLGAAFHFIIPIKPK